MKILFFGDVVGKAGLRAVARDLPGWRDEHQPDLIVANAENAAAGIGITPAVLEELLAAGVEAFTSGDHFIDKDFAAVAEYPIIRPANLVDQHPGVGAQIIKTADNRKVLLINLLGKAFMGRVPVTDFFAEVPKRLAEFTAEQPEAVLIDFHAETTSESNALSQVVDGQVSALVGSHTHVPTADTRILPKGTAYQTDLGMCGAQEGVIGFALDNSLNFLRRDWDPAAKSSPAKAEDNEPWCCDAVLIETDGPTKSRSIRRLSSRSQ